MKLHKQLFLELVRPSWQRLNAVAKQYARSSHDAQDLVQETLLRAWRSFAPTAEKSYRPAWLFVIMRNIALEWRRSSASKIRLNLSLEVELTELLAPDPGEALPPLSAMPEQQFRQFLEDHVAAALDALEPRYREVLILSVAGDLSYREIAEILDCPVGTVMSRIGRARTFLRQRLSDSSRLKMSSGGKTP